MSTSADGPAILLLSEAVTPKFRLSEFNKKNPIIGLEMIAPLALIRTASKLLKGKRVNLHIDNYTAANTLIRGDCPDPVLAAMIRTFWYKAEQLSLDIWIGRVGPTVNPADLPARNKKLPLEILRRVQFNSLFWLMCTTLRDEAQ